MLVLYPKNIYFEKIEDFNNLTLEDFVCYMTPINFLYIESYDWVIVEETSYGGTFSLNLKFYKIVDI